MCERGQRATTLHKEQQRAGTKRTRRTVLRPGLQRGMMGSNNHIITSRASALSDVRGIKEACRVHTQAASLHAGSRRIHRRGPESVARMSPERSFDVGSSYHPGTSAGPWVDLHGRGCRGFGVRQKQEQIPVLIGYSRPQISGTKSSLQPVRDKQPHCLGT